MKIKWTEGLRTGQRSFCCKKREQYKGRHAMLSGGRESVAKFLISMHWLTIACSKFARKVTASNEKNKHKFKSW